MTVSPPVNLLYDKQSTIESPPGQPGDGVFSPFPRVSPSMVADSACPIIPTTLSRLAIVVAFDRVVSIFASARSKFATPRWVYSR